MINPTNFLALIATLLCILINTMEGVIGGPVTLDSRSSSSALVLHGSELTGSERIEKRQQQQQQARIPSSTIAFDPTGTLNGNTIIYPPIVHSNTTYSWTLTSGLFGQVVSSHGDANDEWIYAVASGSPLPGWMTLDGASGTINGMAPLSMTGSQVSVKVTGTSPTASGNPNPITLNFYISSNPPLATSNPLSNQLSVGANTNNSLTTGPRASISSATTYDSRAGFYPGVRIPPNWSFSIGMNPPWSIPSTTSSTSIGSKTIFYSAITPNTLHPIPSWLNFKNSSLTFEGVTPSTSGEYQIALVGSQVWGWPDQVEVFTIVVGSHDFEVVDGDAGVGTGLNENSLRLNWTVGVDLNATTGGGGALKEWWDGPTLVDQFSGRMMGGADGPKWMLDNRTVSEQDIVSINIDVDSVPGGWLKFDNSTRTFAGVPPVNLSGSVEGLSLPMNVTDKYGDLLQTTLEIGFVQSPFNTTNLGSIMIGPNSTGTVDLNPFFKSAGGGNTGNVSASYNVTVSIVPRAASSWINWNPANLTLSGTPPNQLNYSLVSVGLHATSYSSLATSHAWMNLTLSQQPLSSPNSTTAPVKSETNRPKALSHTAVVGVGITMGVLGGLAFFFGLMWFCGRYVEKEKHIVIENGYDPRRSSVSTNDEKKVSEDEKIPDWMKDSGTVGTPKGLGFSFDKSAQGGIASPKLAVLPYSHIGADRVRSTSKSWRKQIAKAARRPVTKLFISNPMSKDLKDTFSMQTRSVGPDQGIEASPAALLTAVFSPQVDTYAPEEPSPSSMHAPNRPWMDTPRSGGSDVTETPGNDSQDSHNSAFESMFGSRASWQSEDDVQAVKAREREWNAREMDRNQMLSSRQGRPGTATTATDSIGRSHHWTPGLGTPGSTGAYPDHDTYPPMPGQAYLPSGPTRSTMSSTADEIATIRTADRRNVNEDIAAAVDFDGGNGGFDLFETGNDPVNLRAVNMAMGSFHGPHSRFVSDSAQMSVANSRSEPSFATGSIIVHNEHDDVITDLGYMASAIQSKRFSIHSGRSHLQDALNDNSDVESAQVTPTMAASPFSRQSSRRGAASPASTASRSIIGMDTPRIISYTHNGHTSADAQPYAF